MARKRTVQSEPCPHCGSRSVWKNGSSRGHVRFRCGDCNKSFGVTFGTPLYRARTEVQEIAQALLIIMRRGSLSAAEEITGHKRETVRDWLLKANEQAEAITGVLVKELELDEVEVDAFWSFVGNAVTSLQRGQARHRSWALAPCPGQPESRGRRSAAHGGRA